MPLEHPELLTMSAKEVDRVAIIRRVLEGGPKLVENKRLGAVLATIQAAQVRRDEARLASPKLTLRRKERLRAAIPSGPSSSPEHVRRGRRKAAPRIVV